MRTETATNYVRKNPERTASWLVRAAIVALLTWTATTLVDVNETLALVEYRVIQLELFHRP